MMNKFVVRYTKFATTELSAFMHFAYNNPICIRKVC